MNEVQSEETAPEPILFVASRPVRVRRGILLASAVLALALVVMAIRAASSDWRGLGQEARGRIESLFARADGPTDPRPSDEAPTIAPTPTPEAKPSDPKAADPPAPAAEDDPGTWDDIRREAEKKKADLAEAEKLKEEADEALARTPVPPPSRGVRARPNPAQMAQMRQRQQEFLRQAQERHEQMFREAQARMMENHRRMEQAIRAMPARWGWTRPSRPASGSKSDFSRE